MYEMTLQIVESGAETSWDVPLSIQRSYNFASEQQERRERVLTSTAAETCVMLPSTNCSLVNGDTLQTVLTENNVTSGDYCLISVLGWSYVLRPFENCPNITSDEDIVFTLSDADILPSTGTSHGNDLSLILVSAISSALILVLAASVLYFYFRVKKEKEHTRKLRIEHYRLRKQLREKTHDVAMLVRAWQIQISELRLVEKIGSGAFGDVWDAFWHEQIEVAVKFIQGTAAPTPQGSNSTAKSSQGNSSSLQSTSGSKFLFDKREIKFLMRTRSPYIVLFLGCGVRGKDHFLVTELCSGGSFDRHIWLKRDELKMTLYERLHIVLDAALGLEFLHKLHRSIHRDIKSPNVLLVKRPSSDYRKTQWMGKLGDFGLARMVLRGKERVQSSLEDKPMSWRKRFLHGRVGTLEWMAPEILQGRQKYGPPIDVYSFALLMWYVILNFLSLSLFLSLSSLSPHRCVVCMCTFFAHSFI